MKIEKFTGELHVLLNLFNNARKSAIGLPTKDASLKELKKNIEGEQIFIAKVDGNIVGFVSVWAKSNFIHHLYVEPMYQSRKIGSALIAKCKEVFGLPLTLKCVEKNLRACSFYEKNGWTEEGKATGPEGLYILYILKDEINV